MRLICGDITKTRADAIVNAASSDLKPHPGICEAIFNAAHTEALQKACQALGYCPIGRAVVTKSYGLPCKYIIHVAGIGWFGGRLNERMLFADCYFNALRKAAVYRCRSVAVPLMFSGDFHVPRHEALRIACGEIRRFEEIYPEIDVMLVLYTTSIYEMARIVLAEEHRKIGYTTM